MGQHPVSVSFPGMTVQMGGTVYAIVQVKVSPSNWSAAVARGTDKAALKQMGLKPHEVPLEADTNRIIQVVQPAVRTPKPEASLESLSKLAMIASAGGAPGLEDRCQKCGTAPAWTFLLNTHLQQMCRRCYEEMAAKYGQAKATVDSVRPNYAKGLAYGLGAAVVGGILWGVVGGLTGFVSGLIALVIGYLVAYAIQYGAGKVDSALVAASVFITLLSITFGGIVWVAVELSGTGLNIGPVQAWWILITNDPGIFAIDHVFGMIGVIGAAYKLQQTAKEHKLPFEVVS